MAIQFQFGAAFNTSVNKPLKPWKYDTAVRVTQSNGSLVKLTDVLGPLDLPTSMKLTSTRIANVYNTLADGSIPVAEQSSNTSGQSIFVELKSIATRVAPVTGTRVQLPFVSRIELRLPNDAEIAESDITEMVMQTFALLCNDAGAPVVVTEKMRGALAPCTC